MMSLDDIYLEDLVGCAKKSPKRPRFAPNIARLKARTKLKTTNVDTELHDQQSPQSQRIISAKATKNEEFDIKPQSPPSAASNDPKLEDVEIDAYFHRELDPDTKLEMDLSIDTVSENYDRSRKKTKMICITPIHAAVQMRPSLEHPASGGSTLEHPASGGSSRTEVAVARSVECSKQSEDVKDEKSNCSSAGAVSKDSMSNETREALRKSLHKIFQVHKRCSFQQICQLLREMAVSESSHPNGMANEAIAAASAIDAHPSEMVEMIEEVATDINGVYAPMTSSYPPYFGLFRNLVVGLLTAEGANPKFRTILKTAKIHELDKDITPAQYETIMDELGYHKKWKLKSCDGWKLKSCEENSDWDTKFYRY